MKLALTQMSSPVGNLRLYAHEHALVAVLWENEDPKRVRLAECYETSEHPILLETQRQLNQYFAGERTVFELELDLQGTEFQLQVWQALAKIPYGEIRSYKQIAQVIGREKAVRAVGAANGKNPISIIIPCHRVVGSNGQLVGFAGGLGHKQTLLSFEQN
ncbi:methylated-DNA-[protein]-cysteine S-methyltransferase [Acinetobacter calcoaceticus]|uniref:Methylated-DNA--protein-cysteine methyltransferase n=1 Tax=Acinetobacter calcoaceticus TaxID=471 RepID=A0A4R1X6I4_ACICA|nr:methylated-DNA-[protein]-cysteine S-methyltransferase [Acinetobacter calcoaceticus]